MEAFCATQEKQLGLIKKGNATIFAITSVALKPLYQTKSNNLELGGGGGASMGNRGKKQDANWLKEEA